MTEESIARHPLGAALYLRVTLLLLILTLLVPVRGQESALLHSEDLRTKERLAQELGLGFQIHVTDFLVEIPRTSGDRARSEYAGHVSRRTHDADDVAIDENANRAVERETALTAFTVPDGSEDRS